jgi:hypothetical protein
VPKCDICQEASGYFFCLEDRALLCRDCDVAIHTVNPFVSAHQRFLLTGIQVGLDPADPVPPVADKHANAGGDSVYKPTKNLSRKSPTVPSSGEGSDSVPSENVIRGDYCRQNYVPTVRNGVVNWTMNNSTIPSLEPQSEYMSDESLALLQSSLATAAFANQINRNNDRAYNLPLSSGNGSENLPDWPVDEFFSSSEFGPNFSFAEHCSTKGDNTKLGSAWGSTQCRLAEGLVAEEWLGLVPGFDAEESWTVPEVPSPPTALGLYWQGSFREPVYDSTMFVPEVSSLQSSQNNVAVPGGFKR